ncbi:putative pectinesterase/pectinesterase inhibitor 28 [Euphorbia lathyris]|uniref:putative pectinesterase/pectinesterase inhibitor 28 n=1 Tax=Euphorbia lathyris TaxID=212925 RepID=UPI0033135218
MTDNNDNDGKKKFAIIGVSSLILVAMVVAVTVGVSNGDEKDDDDGAGPSISTSTKSIQAICQPTDYQKTCESSLSRAAGNTTDPHALVQAGFQVAVDALKVALANSSAIAEAEKDPLAKQALANCKIMMNIAIEDLKASFQSVGEFDINKIDEYIDNLKIWLSATITYQQTCIEGFDNTTGETGKKMKKLLLSSSMLTANGLAMVTGLSSILDELNIPELGGRKLLATSNNDGLPAWVSPSKRRLLAAAPDTIKADIKVALDGSGQYKSIKEAIKFVPMNKQTPFVIHVKAGVYKEKVEFTRNMTNIVLVGDGPKKTVISGELCFAKGLPTLNTATVAVGGAHFVAKDIGFENTAGAIGHQAVALLVESDMSIFYNCHIDGYQNTLYALTYRQFYRNCKISGTVDIIFGDSATVIQDSEIVIRKPIDLQKPTIIAQQRNESREPTGFVIQNSTITGSKEYLPMKETNPAFLGRPQRPFARTIIMQTLIEDVIDPEGWLGFMGSWGKDTCFFGEFENKGAGSDTSKRANWKGIHKINAKDAEWFTAGKFIEGDTWIPKSGVPYNNGMH